MDKCAPFSIIFSLTTFNTLFLDNLHYMLTSEIQQTFSGLELQGTTSPLKSLTRPISNLLAGYTRQSIVDGFDEEISEILDRFEKEISEPFSQPQDNKTPKLNLTQIEMSLRDIAEDAINITSIIPVYDQLNMKHNITNIENKFSKLSLEIDEIRHLTVTDTENQKVNLSDTIDDTCFSTMAFLNNVRNIHPQGKFWSTLSFIIMFLPGVVVGLYALFSKGLRSKTDANCSLYECPLWFQSVLLVLCILMSIAFPIGILATQVFECVILIMAYRSPSIEYEKILENLAFVNAMVTAMEAFFESGPQIILQIYIICATRNITATQAISISFSLIMLAKTTIMYDMMYNETGNGKRSFSQTMKYLLAILPLYISSVIFKTGSISLFTIFFGFYTTVGLGVIFLVLLLITKKMGFCTSDGIVLALTNLTVVSFSFFNLQPFPL